ncbi:MAG: hypothetical protein WA952_11155, partial [Lewinella sp.]
MSQRIRHDHHPLRRGGLSRPERDNPSLAAGTAPVDGRGLGDLLRFWYDYARQVNFYEAEKGGVSPRITGDWLDFFRRSIPFQYASIGAFDLEGMNDRFQDIREGIADRRSLAALNPLLDLLLEMAMQLATWKADLAEDTTGLSGTIQGLIDTSLGEPATRLLGLVNGAAKWGYRPSRKAGLLASVYGLGPTAGFAVDRSISGRRGSPKNKLIAGRDELEELYRLFWKALEATVITARDDERLEASLREPERANTPPSLGLVFSFLLLFRETQGGLNKLSDKHLDFFYRKTLQLRELPLTEDRAHLIFELGKKVEDSLALERGLRFKGGKDGAGGEIIFELQEDLVLTKTQVAEVRTLYIDPPEAAGGEVYVAPTANSGDGMGGDFAKKVPAAWPTVGGPRSVYPNPETESKTQMPTAELALLLASPVFLLREGERKVTVTITLGPSSGELPSVAELNADPPLIPSFSTEEGWLEVPNPTYSYSSPGSDIEIELTLCLKPDYPEVIHPGEEVLPLDVPNQYPVLKLDFSTNLPDRSAWYCSLGQLPVKDVVINVAVCGVRQLVLENDLAVLDPAKPFMPFGPVPKKNSSNFYIGSEELFAKRWSQLAVCVAWLDLPVDLPAHYDGYFDSASDKDFEPENITVDLAIKKNYAWSPADPGSLALLTGNDEEDWPPCTDMIDGAYRLTLTNTNEPDGKPCPWPLSLAGNISFVAPCGVIRLRLGGNDFWHGEYPQALINVAKRNEEIANDAEATGETPSFIAINPPYTPTLAGVSLDYEASDTPAQELVIGHLHPWQHAYEWSPVGNGETSFPLLPHFPHEGHLYIGLADYQPGELLNLYFELDAPTADPTLEKADVKWAYLQGNTWQALLDEIQVISDTTDGLIRSGIVKIALPSTISRNGTTLLPTDYHWVRASVPERTAAIAASLRVST